MGHSQADKAETHERIVRRASKRFREAGLDGIGVADLMKEAGMTVGGFYKHFPSRADLVIEALQAAFAEREAHIEKRRPSFAELTDAYLGLDHRDNPGVGCAVGALLGDAARSSERIRAVYTEQVNRDIGNMASRLDSKEPSAKRAQAIFAFSALVGALGLARAVSDEAFSLEILETVRALLKAQKPARPKKALKARAPHKASKRGARAATARRAR